MIGEPRPMLGIAMKVGSVTAFVASSSFIKLGSAVPLGEQLFIRSLGALSLIVLVLALRGELRQSIRTRRPFGHLWRGGLGILTLMLTMYGLAHLPLSEVITIGYGTPFFIVLFGAALLGEKVGPARWAAVVLGAAGVVVVMWPRLTLLSTGAPGDGATFLATVAMACSCVTGACAMLALRRLGATERSATMTLYFFAFSAVVGLASIAFVDWMRPDARDFAALVAACIAGGCAQLLLAECYKHADLSTIAPLEYVSILFSMVLGIAVFNESLSLHFVVGVVLVVSSGLMVIFHENRRD